jgi:hypothetical protein
MRGLFIRCGLSILFVYAFFGTVAAADEPPKLAGTAATFAGVPWGSAPDTIHSTLAQRGYQFAETDGDGDLVFSGKSGATNVDVFEVLDPAHKLVKSLIVIHPAANDLIDVFHSVGKALTDKFGAPSAVYEEYSGTHTGAKTDDDRRAAIAAGDATLASFWFYADGSVTYAQVAKELTIQVSYESPRWTAEAARRKAAAAGSH